MSWRLKQATWGHAKDGPSRAVGATPSEEARGEPRSGKVATAQAQEGSCRGGEGKQPASEPQRAIPRGGGEAGQVHHEVWGRKLGSAPAERVAEREKHSHTPGLHRRSIRE